MPPCVLGVQFFDDNYTSPYSKMHIHGSWLRAASWNLRTAQTPRLLHVFFHAVDPHRAVITEEGKKSFVLIEGEAPFVAEDVRVHFVSRKLLEVRTLHWRTTAESTIAYPHANKLRMNVKIQPLQAGYRGGPHGLLGQTYDGDRWAVHGLRDDYGRLDSGALATSRVGVGGEKTTRAAGEGAIEGTLEDYRLRDRFQTSFRFSRFDAEGLPRDVSALSGRRSAMPTTRKQPSSLPHLRVG